MPGLRNSGLEPLATFDTVDHSLLLEMLSSLLLFLDPA